ncbi:unnamed protein product [Phaedon cochleariae]|uniref:C2H2-type domain-containing protein n=1 Tax=Phaedon cochleariae TaxID=80249 RepID=A0A9N9X3E3_PHACE|nr:unnamed protein product [Phaedon cochleariae]
MPEMDIEKESEEVDSPDTIGMNIKEESEEEDSPDIINVKTELFDDSLDQTFQEFNCTKCPEKYRNEMSLKIHLMLHQNHNYCFICKKTMQKNFHKHLQIKHLECECSVCGNGYLWTKSLKKHISIHTGDGGYVSCDQCDKLFRQNSSLKRHVQYIHQGIKPFVCEVCGGSFTTKSSLKKHIRKIHADYRKNEVYECNICPEIFCNIQSRMKHESAHISSKSCEICKLTFANPSVTRRHLRAQHYNTETCPYCMRKFHKSMLDSHIKTVHQKRDCRICKSSFRNSISWAKHNLEHQHKHSKQCNICGCKLDGIDIEKHNKLHLEGKIHHCTICNKLFANIKRHQANVHKNTDYIYCKMCPMKFPTSTARIKHFRRIHEYVVKVCSICRRKFRSFEELREHLSVHHNTSYKCRICHEPIFSLMSLRDHEVQHAGVSVSAQSGSTRAFKCQTCGRKFKFLDSLENHKCRKGMYYCHLCDVRYCSLPNVKRHMINHHTPRVYLDEQEEEQLEKNRLRLINLLRGTKKKYQCKKCHTSLASLETFKKHYCRFQVYKGRGREPLKKRNTKLECEYCGWLSYNKNKLRNHIVRKHIMKKSCDDQTENHDKSDSNESATTEIIYIKIEKSDDD